VIGNGIVSPSRLGVEYSFAYGWRYQYRLPSAPQRGITLGSSDCQILSLPNEGLEEVWLSSDGNKTRQCTRPFVILSFTKDLQGPRFHLEEEKDGMRLGIATVLSRCTLIRSVVELWGLGFSIDGCADNVRVYRNDRHGQDFVGETLGSVTKLENHHSYSR
jgi:hypothetical protein